ncbi:MAG: efflux RND transporter periplasmic adaptor subunit [Deltaproteobacteria bacterium]|nr:efflux RND transporter periplasmic adaptor subunit [Deltaproteobacteria bacterium]
MPMTFETAKKSIAAATICAFAVLAGCGNTDRQAEAQPRAVEQRNVKVSVITVKPTPIKDIIVLPGETAPLYDVQLASDLDGVVESIGPKEGDEVNEGQLIAQIDVSALKAALESSEATFQLADRVYSRRKELYQKGVFANEELEKSLTERTLAESNLRRARVEYQRGFLRSPARGLINRIPVDVGEYVARGQVVAELVNVVKIKISINVPESDVRYLKEGQETLVNVDAYPDRSFKGAIDFISYKADPATKTFPVRVVIFNHGRDVRPGMIARVVFLRRMIPDAIVAPLSALVDKGGERLVFIEKNGVVHARTVAIGIIAEDKVQIVHGLQPGDRLIVVGQTEVEEGMRVDVQ